MIDLTHAAQSRRVRRWQALLEPLKQPHLDRVRRYAGPGMTGDTNMTNYDPIAHTYGAMSRWGPKVLSGNPRFSSGSSRKEAKDDAQKIEAGLNRLVVQSDWVTTNEMLWADYWIGPFGFSYNSMEPVPGFSEYDELPYWPSRIRIPPFSSVGDAEEGSWKKWRFMGHQEIHDIQDLLDRPEEEGWNRTLLESVESYYKRSQDSMRLLKSDEGDFEDRDEIDFYRIWVPEVKVDHLRDMGYDIPEKDDLGRTYTPEGGYNGAVFYVLRDRDVEQLEGIEDGCSYVRAPHMHYGHRTGPYTYYAGYVIPDESITLAPDVATTMQAAMANTGSRAMLRAIERTKEVTGVAAEGTDIADAINDAEDGTAVTLRNLADGDIRKAVQVLRTGGASPELAAGAAYVYEIYQRASGMNDAQMGELPGGQVKATSVAVATQAAGAVIDNLARKFRNGCERDGMLAAWWMFHDERFEMEMPNGHIMRGGPDSAVIRRQKDWHPILEAFFGKGAVEGLARLKEKKEERERKLRKQDPFDAMDYSIDQFSMERTEAGMASAQLAGLRDTLSVLPGILMQFPFVRADELTQVWGEMSNVKGLDRIIDPQILHMMRMLLLKQQFEPNPAAEQPRLGMDQPSHTQMPMVDTAFLQGGSQKPGSMFQMPQLGQQSQQPAPGGAQLPGRSTGALAGAASSVG